MTTPLDIQGAMSATQSAPIQAPHAGKTLAQTKKAAQDFEAVFVQQFLGSMFEGIQTDGMFGGGQGEQIFRSMMLEQYGKSIASQGGLGIADSVTRSLIQHQEAQQRTVQEAADKANGKTDTDDNKGFAVTKDLVQFAAHTSTNGFATSPKTAAAFSAHPGYATPKKLG